MLSIFIGVLLVTYVLCYCLKLKRPLILSSVVSIAVVSSVCVNNAPSDMLLVQKSFNGGVPISEVVVSASLPDF